MNEDRSSRYHRLKRRVAVLSTAWGVGVLVLLLATGASTALREAVASAAAGVSERFRATVEVLGYTSALLALTELSTLPLAFYGSFLLERRYGLSKEPIGGWLKDQAKSLGLLLLIGGAAAVVLYAVIRRWPGGWWAPAGVMFAVAIVGLTNLAPVALLPLFYSVKPLDREALRARLLALAERAGARVIGVYEWGLSEKTTKANAALAGLGSTRRILVSDTMLHAYTDDEIEVVLAHELAHHVYGDIWKGLIFEAVLVVLGFYAAFRALDASVGPLGLSGVNDVAGLPLLLLAAGAVSMAMLPIAHAISRAHERRADRFALDLTKNPAAFVSAMRRLAAQNLAEDQPSTIVRWLFYSHPPIRERIAAAQKFSSLHA